MLRLINKMDDNDTCVVCGVITEDLCYQCGDHICDSCSKIHADLCPASDGEAMVECPDCNGKGYWLGLVHKHICDKCEGLGSLHLPWTSNTEAP